jgi:hypothetical protein
MNSMARAIVVAGDASDRVVRRKRLYGSPILAVMARRSSEGNSKPTELQPNR